MIFTEEKELPGWARAMGGCMVAMCVVPVIVIGFMKRMSLDEIKQCIRGE